MTMDESLEREGYEISNAMRAPDGRHRWDPDCSCPACEEVNEQWEEEAMFGI